MKTQPSSFRPFTRIAVSLALVGQLLVLSACNQDADTNTSSQASAAPALPVSVHQVETEPVTLKRELSGRTSPLRIAEVRARVNGIIEKRHFVEGAMVQAGELLYQIDPAPYQAQLDAAQANLERVEASYASAQQQAKRYKTLVETNAVSRQNYDDANAAALALKAEIAAAKASLRVAEINLGYTRVTAPITGRIGQSEVTEGAYVQQASATLLSTIQQLDTLYLDLNESAEEVLQLQEDLATGKLENSNRENASIEVILADGSLYPELGSLQFSDVSVNTTTGTVKLRATLPNPDAKLLPGMFLRARLIEGIDPDAILVPHSLVGRNSKGQATVYLVNEQNTVEVRIVETDRSIGSAWLITDGLQAGERIISNNLQKIRPGMAVQPQAATSSDASNDEAPTA
ncbi:MAG TPA: efflux transporter periplasmic adaptor subunit [Opitutae bacterium]|nr:efflux transporter periplasmic adaptor subunit [Puniceicoccaceae bacterium]HBR93515.1 efflux transporter periplasmic adaptor subunit [Opitutae bacterium]|tara:strand:+ start:1841 stop:3049 length:1209 start_codon:yes stop_codon:yes gene_type:complete